MAQSRLPAPRRRHRRQPHPVRPGERQLRARVQPGHADRRPRGPRRPSRPGGRAGRRGRRRGRAQAQPRLQPHPRGGARLEPVGPHPCLRRAAGLRHGSRGRHPRRQQDRPGPDRLRHRRRRRHGLRRPDRRERGPARDAAGAQPRQDRRPAAQGTRAVCGRASSCPRSRATSSRAPGCRWASTWPRPPSGGASAARPRTSSRRPATATSPPPTSAASSTTSMTPFLGRHPRREPAPRLLGREAGHAQPGVRQGRGRHDDGRQLARRSPTAPPPCCSAATSGPPSAACRCWPTSSTPQTAAVDYVTGDEGLLMAPAYALPRLLDAPGHDAPGLRPRRDPRGLRVHGAGHPGGLGGRGVLPRPARPRRRRSGRSTAAASTSTARRWPPGHPFAATGGRIVASLAKMLHEKGSGARGLISICAAGGQGVMAILEAA